MFQSNLVGNLREELIEEKLIEERKQAKNFYDTARWIDKVNTEIGKFKEMIDEINLRNMERQLKIERIKSESSILTKIFGMEKPELENEIRYQEQVKELLINIVDQLQILVNNTPSSIETRASVIKGLKLKQVELMTEKNKILGNIEEIKGQIHNTQYDWDPLKNWVKQESKEAIALLPYQQALDAIDSKFADIKWTMTWAESLSE